jgi:hypothetical protein
MIKTQNIKDVMNEYKSDMFTETGYETLYNYTQQLALMYLKNEEYPLSWGLVFDIPNFKYSNKVQTKQDLKQRIIANMQLLGVEILFVKDGNEEIEFSFEESN